MDVFDCLLIDTLHGDLSLGRGGQSCRQGNFSRVTRVDRRLVCRVVDENGFSPRKCLLKPSNHAILGNPRLVVGVLHKLVGCRGDTLHRTGDHIILERGTLLARGTSSVISAAGNTHPRTDDQPLSHRLFNPVADRFAFSVVLPHLVLCRLRHFLKHTFGDSRLEHLLGKVKGRGFTEARNIATALRKHRVNVTEAKLLCELTADKTEHTGPDTSTQRCKIFFATELAIDRLLAEGFSRGSGRNRTLTRGPGYNGTLGQAARENTAGSGSPTQHHG